MLWVRSSTASAFDRARSDFARAIEREKSVSHVLETDKKTAENQHNMTPPLAQSSRSTLRGDIRVFGILLNRRLDVHCRLNGCRSQGRSMRHAVSL